MLTRLAVGLDQKQYLEDLLRRLNMQDSATAPTPIVSRLSADNAGAPLSSEDHANYRMAVGSLLYLACWTRPDISFAVSELSRFVSAPAEAHMKAVKHLVRYLRGTMDLGLLYSKTAGGAGPPSVLTAYVDADWAGDPDFRRSTTGYVLVLNGAAISWKSKRQTAIALSSAEAEFMAASSLVQEMIYIRRLLERLGFPQSEPTPIGEDNRTCVAWAEGAVGGSDRAKHIDLRVHFVHEAVQANVLSLQVVRSADNLADLFTKPLAQPVFVSLRRRLMGE